MVKASFATLKERLLIKRVEAALFEYFEQENFFQTDLIVVDEDTICKTNSSMRGVDRVTDVLSFPQFDKLELPISIDKFEDSDFAERGVLLGNIMICRQRAIEQAKQYGHSYAREFAFLVCHSFLHLLGFDHIEQEDEKIMIAHQKAIMDLAGIKRN